MPRRPRRQPSTETAAPAPAAVVVVLRPETAPNERKVRDLLRLNRVAKENMDELRGSLGGTMSDAVENHGLHKKAFGWIKQLDGMSPEKINDLMAHFRYYFVASGLETRAASAPRLPTGDEPAAEAESPPAESEARRTGTVTPFPAQAAAG